jgi:hypothetical protein
MDAPQGTAMSFYLFMSTFQTERLLIIFMEDSQTLVCSHGLFG